MKDARVALHELRDYFEQKRNLAICKRWEETDKLQDALLTCEIGTYNHAMEMADTYIRELPK